ncbi:slo-interacting protein 1 [Microplitis demolitor]|uniref:slo-interacting protein 1 n=1 Tax=Microplitis demolitor TaxID=69319 RepID=UPI0004CCB8EF|nr:slo-interacting protein 1 [Microplitis demolitor]
MDLVILKVNGQDVTNSSHEDTLKIFKTAQEPITIEVIRMQPNKCKNTGDSNDLSINTVVNQQQVTPGTKKPSATTSCTTGVQTDLSGFINVDDDDYFYNYFVYEDDVDGVNYEIAQEQDDEELDVDDREAVEINDYLSNSNNDDEYHQLETFKPEDVDDGSGGAGADDVYLEEITLRKSKSTENLGLTVSYNYDITDRNNPTDITAVAYISEIARDSLAARDGRLREGDQILRINGRDIVNKDQIDKIFYQTQNNIVNILISRCVGQNSPPPAPPSSSVSSFLNNIDEPPAVVAATVTASETDEHSPAYQNSMIELLMRQQKQFENSKNNKSLPNETNDDNSDNKILIPPQVPFHNNLPLSTSSLSSATPKNINKSFNKTSQHHSLTSNFKESLKKFEDLSINKKSVTGLVTSTSTVAALAAAACHSDTEHIYETIPESDSEPIYSSPYESQYLPRTFELNQQQHANQSKLSTKNSSSSIEEKDSSSAYNTGGESCNSNPLLLELYRSDRDGNDEGTMGLSSFDIGSTPTGAMTSIKSPVTLMSTAMNCRVKSSEVTPVTRSNSSSSSLSIVTSPRQPIPKSLLSQEDKKLLSEAHYHQQQQQQYHHNHNYRHQCHHHHHYHNYQNKIPAINPNCQLPQDDNRELAITNNRDDILYTNIDNNDSSKRTTMILQQEIFTQALNRKNFITNRSNTCESDREIRIKNSKSHGKFQAPNLTQYHFIGSSQQMQRNPANDDNAGGKCDPRMEWKVKRRPDGTRYIARRSVRNRLLGNRTLEIFEERAGQTTEDDTVSEIKLGRYWNKDERKRHIEHARQRKLRHQAAMPPPAPPTTLVAQQHFKLRRDFNCEHRADDSAVTAEATSTKELSKKLIQDAIMTHVNRIDDNHDDEDGMLGGGGGGTAGDDDALTINGKLKGLLSVTTV